MASRTVVDGWLQYFVESGCFIELMVQRRRRRKNSMSLGVSFSVLLKGKRRSHQKSQHRYNYYIIWMLSGEWRWNPEACLAISEWLKGFKVIRWKFYLASASSSVKDGYLFIYFVWISLYFLGSWATRSWALCLQFQSRFLCSGSECSGGTSWY